MYHIPIFEISHKDAMLMIKDYLHKGQKVVL